MAHHSINFVFSNQTNKAKLYDQIKREYHRFIIEHHPSFDLSKIPKRPFSLPTNSQV